MIYTKLFEEILEKPTLFVGNCNIRHIYFFMKGYIDANWQNGNQDTTDIYFGFPNWIAKDFKVSPSLTWANVITLYSCSEEHAFEVTVKSWNEYKASIKLNSPTIEIHEQKIKKL